uniref:Uncharacterized protein n=1 Tax=Rhizophora mucronata TaxID=61149 RepID=A0A2P2R1Q0_RHIMU
MLNGFANNSIYNRGFQL